MISDPDERIPVTMTRKQWSALLDTLVRNLESGIASPVDIDVTVALACSIIHGGVCQLEESFVRRVLLGEGGAR